MNAQSRGAGPFDDRTWPDKLKAHVVEPGEAPRVFGYDVQRDLAASYRWGEVFLLALTGELPASSAVAAAFDVALAFLAPISVAEAPGHAAILARTCAGTTSAILATSVIALGEQARTVVERYAPWLDWLAAPSAEVPLVARGESVDRAPVVRLRAAIEKTELEVRGLERDVTIDAALIAVLAACGIVLPWQIETTWVSARLPVVAAEAFAREPAGFREYPLTLPPFRYEEEP